MKRNSFVIILILISAAIFTTKDSFAAATWVSTSPLPPAYVGVPYSHQLQATTAVPPILYSIVGGSMPGLSLSPTGLISGTVTNPGTATVTIQALDASPIAGPVTRVFSISYLAGGVTGPLRIKRLQVRFDNNRPEITVRKNHPPPRVFADLSYIGSGILRGYWSVDGAVHSQINRSLVSGAELVLTLPAVPPLPTYQTGGHRVSLVITEPVIASGPEAIYYVTGEEKKVFAPISIISPADRMEVEFTPLTLSWQLQQNTTAYLVEFLEDKEGEPIFSAYTRSTSYTIPAHTLAGFFAGNRSYAWRVKAVAEDDKILNESGINYFSFR